MIGKIMETGWISPHIVFILFHIFGSVIGAGAAYMGDLIFLYISRKKIIDLSEFQLMKLLSSVVWIGLLMLFLSGIGLVWERPQIFLHSGKFWAKMTILGILILNGILFLLLHFPTIKKGIGKKFSPTNPINKKQIPLIVSGTISVVSWTTIIILGVLGRTPFSYFQFLGVYLVVLILSVGGSLFLKDRLIPLEK